MASCRWLGHTVRAAGIGLVAAGAHAQASEPLVWSASRYAQSTYEAPASVTVVTREEIQRFGWRTISEVLAAAGGMFASDDRNYRYLTVRGLAKPGDLNTRVLLMLDGRRLNQPVDDSSGIGTEAGIDLDAVDRIEIIRGPGSSLYGTNAFHAVVNVVTRRRVDGLEANGTAGSLGTASGSLSAGGRTAGGVDIAATASGYHSSGADLYYPEFDTPGTNGGRAVGLDGDGYGRAFARASRGDFSLEGFYSTRTKHVPTASFDTLFGDGRERTRDSAGMLSLAYEHAFEDLSRAWASASYNSASYDGDYPYADGVFSDYTRARWLSFDGQYQRFLGAHRLSAGGEARWNARVAQGGSGVFSDERSSWVLAAFAQAELHFVPWLTLHAGARYDHYESFGGTLNPRLALVAEPWSGTFLKASYGRAFRAPSAYELYYQDGGITQEPALELHPERLWTAEAAIEQRLRPGLKASLDVYRTQVSDVVGLTRDDTDGLLVFANGGTARAKGVELRLEGQLGRLLGRASYAFQSADEGEARTRPPGSPRELGQLGASAAWLGGQLVTSLELLHVGERPAIDGTPIAAYTVANATVLLRPRFASRWQLEARLANLLGATYFDPGGQEHRQLQLVQDGRTGWIGVRARF